MLITILFLISIADAKKIYKYIVWKVSLLQTQNYFYVLHVKFRVNKSIDIYLYAKYLQNFILQLLIKYSKLQTV